MAGLWWVLATAWAADGLVELDRDALLSLQPPVPPEVRSPEPRVERRDVVIDPVGRTFSATFRVVSVERAWVDLLLVGRGVRVEGAEANGARAPVVARPDGSHLVAEVEGTWTVEVRGSLDEGATSLALAPASVGTVKLPAQLELVASDGRGHVRVGEAWWTGSGALAWREPQVVGDAGAVVVGQVGLGLTVGEGELSGRARVRWVARRGELSEVSLRVSGVGDDLAVEGPSVADWRREGDRVVVALRRPEPSVTLELRWSSAVPAGDEATLPLPRVVPLGVSHGATTVQLARDGDLEVVPELTEWTPIATSALPELGRDLIEGTPTAAYQAPGERGGDLGLYRFSPVSGPPVLVDVAAVTVATTDEGRVLMRALYQVRNDRAPWLRVTPPAGTTIIGARVAGRTANVGRDGDTWLVPLAKSVETVEGLLSFPVEVTLLGELDAWSPREATLALPAIDAPVARSQATVHLPPGWRDRTKPGEGDVVDAFSEGAGLAYGLAVGDTKAIEADALLQDAVSRWMDNDFSGASSALDQIEALGVEDENVDKLRSNLDVVSGKDAGGEVALERRVVEQAKARSKMDIAKQEEVLEEAEEAWLAGDYAAAEQAYGQALELGEKLQQTEQKESVDVASSNVFLSSKLEEAKKKVASSSSSTRQTYREVEKNLDEDPAEASPVVVYKARTEIDFEDLEITGELVKPQGAVMSGTLGGLGVSGQGMGGGGQAAPEEPYAPEPEPVYATESLALELPVEASRETVMRGPTGGRRDAQLATLPESTVAVTAASLSVVVPTHGEPVRFQHYLSAPGATLELELRARPPRRNR